MGRTMRLKRFGKRPDISEVSMVIRLVEQTDAYFARLEPPPPTPRG